MCHICDEDGVKLHESRTASIGEHAKIPHFLSERASRAAHAERVQALRQKVARRFLLIQGADVLQRTRFCLRPPASGDTLIRNIGEKK
jgi:hypothetical protein